MNNQRYSTVFALALGLSLALAACTGPGGAADPISSGEALGAMDAMATDVEDEWTRLGDDADLAAVAGFFQDTVTLTPVGGMLEPMQLGGASQLPRGVVAWSAAEGYAPVAGATPPAPYDFQVLGNPVEPSADLQVDWDTGAPTEEFAVGSTTVELPVDAEARVLVGDDRVADATFVAAWTAVEETRCSATEPSLTATSLALDVNVGTHSLSVDAATTSSDTTLAIDAGIGILVADLTFTMDDQVRILATPCPADLPLGGAIGTPSSATLDAGLRSPDHHATIRVDLSGATYGTTEGEAALATADLTGSLTIDGSVAVGIDGSFDANASPPFTIVVRFHDRTMTIEQIAEELSGTAP